MKPISGCRSKMAKGRRRHLGVSAASQRSRLAAWPRRCGSIEKRSFRDPRGARHGTAAKLLDVRTSLGHTSRPLRLLATAPFRNTGAPISDAVKVGRQVRADALYNQNHNP
jgi:hypothetical protein